MLKKIKDKWDADRRAEMAKDKDDGKKTGEGSTDANEVSEATEVRLAVFRSSWPCYVLLLRRGEVLCNGYGVGFFSDRVQLRGMWSLVLLSDVGPSRRIKRAPGMSRHRGWCGSLRCRAPHVLYLAPPTPLGIIGGTSASP